MSYPDNPDDNPFKELGKIFNELQKKLFDQIQNGDFNLDSASGPVGFSVHMGPDGFPHIVPIKDNNTNEEYEEPFVDVFLINNDTAYQIVMDIPGIDLEDVKLSVSGNEFSLIAENDLNKYKKSMVLKYNLDGKNLNYTIRNGILEIIVSII